MISAYLVSFFRDPGHICVIHKEDLRSGILMSADIQTSECIRGAGVPAYTMNIRAIAVTPRGVLHAIGGYNTVCHFHRSIDSDRWKVRILTYSDKETRINSIMRLMYVEEAGTLALICRDVFTGDVQIRDFDADSSTLGPAHTIPHSSCAWGVAARGRMLALRSYDQTIRVYDVHNKTEVFTSKPCYSTGRLFLTADRIYVINEKYDTGIRAVHISPDAVNKEWTKLQGYVDVGAQFAVVPIELNGRLVMCALGSDGKTTSCRSYDDVAKCWHELELD